MDVMEIRTVVVGVHPPKATYTSAKTGHWNSSGIQWKFHSSQDPLEWSGSDPYSTPLHPQSTLAGKLSVLRQSRMACSDAHHFESYSLRSRFVIPFVHKR
jgi:hypothetical protein